MNKEKVKHITLIIIAVALIGIGYLNYDYDTSLEVASVDNIIDESTIGDAQLVNANIVKNEIVPNDNEVEQTNTTVDKSDDYFSETRLERDAMYSQMIETYQKMIDSTQITNEQKAIAIQEIDKITNMKNAIMIAENLIKNKNFDNVVILVSNGNASVIVKNSNLTGEQIAQIQNIIVRELSIETKNLTISSKN